MLVIQNLVFFNIIFFIGRGLNIFFELYFTKNKKSEYFGIRKNYYKLNSGREDGLIFTKHLEIGKLSSFFNQMTYMITSIFKIKN